MKKSLIPEVVKVVVDKATKEIIGYIRGEKSQVVLSREEYEANTKRDCPEPNPENTVWA